MDLEFVPDLAREAAFEIINERWFADRQAFAFFQLPTDYQEVGEDLASVSLYTSGGNEGDIDRTDQLTVEVYAPGTDAVNILEGIRGLLVNGTYPHDLESGYVDEIRCTTTPYDQPFHGSVNLARAIFAVTHRPQHIPDPPEVENPTE